MGGDHRVEVGACGVGVDGLGIDFDEGVDEAGVDVLIFVELMGLVAGFDSDGVGGFEDADDDAVFDEDGGVVFCGVGLGG